ncbi:hypothetical protein A0H76_2431 [Hepatospora eriocheir]|uniref:Uncharacterized protein n=1 Tax=Hepatospora eriocheir TaxID=1081669 RepID=A0A1X0QK30_9MICR|nr:hypothetical protein A0H76_2431 [Hepatospora eriocheir]
MDIKLSNDMYVLDCFYTSVLQNDDELYINSSILEQEQYSNIEIKNWKIREAMNQLYCDLDDDSGKKHRQNGNQNKNGSKDSNKDILKKFDPVSPDYKAKIITKEMRFVTNVNRQQAKSKQPDNQNKKEELKTKSDSKNVYSSNSTSEEAMDSIKVDEPANN